MGGGRARAASPALAAAFLLLTACQGVSPVMDTLTVAWPWQVAPRTRLQSGFEYLSVALNGRTTIMALGERKFIPSSRGVDRHEYWYSAQNEMLHTINGRIHRAIGFTVEWRGQRASPPSWTDPKEPDREVHWVRVLDVMPGYRYGQIDRLMTKNISAPTVAPQGLSANAAWFEDAVVSATETNQQWDFRQRFAVLNGQVVYSEQCLSPKICLSLRPLPLEETP